MVRNRERGARQRRRGAHRLAAAGLVLSVLLLGCERDPVRPVDISGSYTLRQIGGADLPVVTSTGPSYTNTTVGGSLTLGSDRTYSSV